MTLFQRRSSQTPAPPASSAASTKSGDSGSSLSRTSTSSSQTTRSSTRSSFSQKLRRPLSIVTISDADRAFNKDLYADSKTQLRPHQPTGRGLKILLVDPPAASRRQTMVAASPMSPIMFNYGNGVPSSMRSQGTLPSKNKDKSRRSSMAEFPARSSVSTVRRRSAMPAISDDSDLRSTTPPPVPKKDVHTKSPSSRRSHKSSASEEIAVVDKLVLIKQHDESRDESRNHHLQPIAPLDPIEAPSEDFKPPLPEKSPIHAKAPAKSLHSPAPSLETCESTDGAEPVQKQPPTPVSPAFSEDLSVDYSPLTLTPQSSHTDTEHTKTALAVALDVHVFKTPGVVWIGHDKRDDSGFQDDSFNPFDDEDEPPSSRRAVRSQIWL